MGGVFLDGSLSGGGGGSVRSHLCGIEGILSGRGYFVLCGFVFGMLYLISVYMFSIRGGVLCAGQGGGDQSSLESVSWRYSYIIHVSSFEGFLVLACYIFVFYNYQSLKLKPRV